MRISRLAASLLIRANLAALDHLDRSSVLGSRVSNTFGEPAPHPVRACPSPAPPSVLVTGRNRTGAPILHRPPWRPSGGASRARSPAARTAAMSGDRQNGAP